MSYADQFTVLRANALATLEQQIARLDRLTARTIVDIRATGADQAKIDQAIAEITAEHELELVDCLRQRAAILAGAPWWPIDPLQV
jgi:septal ring factor EnvC (AmiA/AmiB activator)